MQTFFIQEYGSSSDLKHKPLFYKTFTIILMEISLKKATEHHELNA